MLRDRDDQHTGQEHQQQADRQKELPAEAHQLVIAQARQRSAHPHEDEDHNGDLHHERNDG